MKQYQSKHTAALSTRGFYTILSLCALIIAASAWVIWGNAHRQNAVEPDTGMPIIAPADSTAEAPTEPATVPQQEQEPAILSVILKQGVRPSRAMTLVVYGIRRRRRAAAPDRGTAGRGGRAGTGGDGQRTRVCAAGVRSRADTVFG